MQLNARVHCLPSSRRLCGVSARCQASSACQHGESNQNCAAASSLLREHFYVLGLICSFSQQGCYGLFTFACAPVLGQLPSTQKQGLSLLSCERYIGCKTTTRLWQRPRDMMHRDRRSGERFSP
ncbi:uncharacterized protein SCHCODRAFT_02229730 [Schizophyllum commune H4-8]|uniref:uncharacterized protein n=1 Tax=Schizophyllum commune (strain H4-8 / FGSC 9210) TaxID=578458 RepID=UPI00215E6ED5|nr:uncharacterized protein SCHCODRAFT_02229730 [Schizophyllum commune H4-8]KAI5895371.1 hypothetical protein SCHCODRAFT_02229730 [Schizophyllum commune H4-8]